MKCRESTCSQITAPLHQHHPGLPVVSELPVVGHQQEAVRLGLGQHDSVEGILVGRAVLLPLEGFQRHHVPVVHRKFFEARLLAVVQELGSGNGKFSLAILDGHLPHGCDAIIDCIAGVG